MARNKRGRQSFVLESAPVITHWASVAGKKESEGPLAHWFDITSQDPYWGQKTWEQGEKQMQKLALEKLLEKSGLQEREFSRSWPWKSFWKSPACRSGNWTWCFPGTC